MAGSGAPEPHCLPEGPARRGILARRETQTADPNIQSRLWSRARGTRVFGAGSIVRICRIHTFGFQPGNGAARDGGPDESQTTTWTRDSHRCAKAVSAAIAQGRFKTTSARGRSPI